ncbi:Nuclear speckle splicing regulatory protein 1-like protein [Mycena sanguinolenta]|uniref:Nuclear speckle splicing regulatory protein 1-like protein n=1 Tax=Mycena sanguinolenta TaxID=230812 RepID=A0A8H7D8K6_9AGAR|nr:Nuclear speckle splicing regulatory protein 1-like protein [Mycena sanguinolenta]
MKLSFSLAKPKASSSASAAPAPSLKRPAAFAFGDDEPVDAAPTASLDKAASANKKLLAQNVHTSKTMQKRMDAEKKVDPTVFEYDEVWDKMQESKLKQKEVKQQEAKDKKVRLSLIHPIQSTSRNVRNSQLIIIQPKYIAALLASAKTRELDHLRAEEKLMQRERELEGDEFADKEMFVTQAYKDQMAAVRAAEEEEKKRDGKSRPYSTVCISVKYSILFFQISELLKKQGGGSSGMAHFYRKLLEDSEQKHEATVAATQKPVIGPMPNLTITKPPDFTPMSDLELAKRAREEGKDVELNDDNQIVDKRDLLVAGLNLSAPNTRKLERNSKMEQGKNNQEVQAHRAVGTAASRREINERRAREIQVQMEQEEERLEKEKAREEREATQRIVARRNDEGAVQTARERYQERKRQRLEMEQQQSAAAGEPD